MSLQDGSSSLCSFASTRSALRLKSSLEEAAERIEGVALPTRLSTEAAPVVPQADGVEGETDQNGANESPADEEEADIRLKILCKSRPDRRAFFWSVKSTFQAI